MIKTSYIPIIISLDELTELGRAGDLDDDIHRRQVEDSIERQEAQEAVNNFLYSIPLKDREIIKRVYWDGISQAKIARELGVSRAAINKMKRKVLHQGKRELSHFKYIH